MSANDDFIDVGVVAAEIVTAICSELEARIRRPTDMDLLAIRTAVAKAARRGVLGGVAAHTYAANAVMERAVDEAKRQFPDEPIGFIQTPTYLVGENVGEPGQEPDPWADACGGDA